LTFTTGIKKLDEFLGGGFPEGSSVLIEGVPGTGKNVMAMHFLYGNIKKSKEYYMFYGPNVNQIMEMFKKYGMDISKSKNLTWFDTNNLSKEDEVINFSMDDLTTLTLAMSQFYEKNKKKKIAGVVTVLSPALITKEPVIIYRFLYEMIQKLKKYNANAIFLLEEGMHKKDTVIAIEGLCDFVINTKLVEKGKKAYRTLRIKKSIVPVSLDLHKYDITEKGIKIIP